MFEGLKKKFSSFIDSVTKKEKEELKEQAPQADQPAPQKAVPETPQHKSAIQNMAERMRAEEMLRQDREYNLGTGREGAEPVTPPPAPEAKKPEPKPHKEAKVTLGTKIKGVVMGEVKINEKDVEPFIEQLKMAMLESDVNYDVAEKVAARLQANMVGKPIPSRGIEGKITEIIRESILEVLSKKPGPDVVQLAKSRHGTGEPLKIMFLGPNGAGKTTTIAKFASMMKSNGLNCVLAASDTFRAAAIEQLSVHADRISVPIIKGGYGADPASIAFDAIAYARAHNADVVLIDTAGRQETNKSLMEEMKKINRVTKPDLRIFIGESISGNALLDQVREFGKAIGVDGVILTKLDVDAKGGNTLSILSDTETPILFFGVGEKYTDLMPYRPDFVVNNILPENN